MRFVVEQRMRNQGLAMRLQLNCGWVEIKHYNTRRGAERAAKTMANFPRTKRFDYRVSENVKP